MIRHQNVWLPDGESHLTKWMSDNGELIDGKGTYQIKKLRQAIARCTDYRTAVDIGAHVGLWSMQLVKHFKHLVAFEPVAAHRECFLRNFEGVDPSRWTLHACALGSHNGSVTMRTAPTSSGDTSVAKEEGDIAMRKLDDFALSEVDFIKLDCEGYELFALRGGRATIERNLPVIIVEQKPGKAQRFGLPETEAVAFLGSLGYECIANLSGDFIMVPA